MPVQPMAETSETRKPDPYQVVARRFRPRHFDEVVGQEAVVQMLSMALSSGRIPHAFLFSGSRGVGKTTLARVLARALNCEKGPTVVPCDSCGACVAILAGSSPDVIEIDAASHNSVDDIRELRDRVGLASMGSRYKVYILDEVHMLTRSAFNAFLKTLEEPPPGVVFIMATTELHKVPETIRSRCQIQLFRRVDETDITQRLAVICEREGVELSEDVLNDVAASSRGGMRDAEGALERLIPIAREAGGQLDLATYRGLVHRVGFDAATSVVASLLRGEPAEALRFAAEVVECGADEREALGEILDVLRALLMMQVDGPESALVTYPAQARARLAEMIAAAPQHRVEAMIQAGLLGRERIRRLEDRRLVLEMALLAMARAGTLPQLGEMLEAARTGAPAPAPTPANVPGVTAGASSGMAPAGAARGAPAGEDLRARLLDRLTTEQPMLGRTIEHCQVTGPDANQRVRIALQTERKLHRDRLAAAGVQKTLREVLRDLLGRNVELVFDTVSAQEAAEVPAPAQPDRTPPPAAPSQRRRAKPGPSVQKVVERFDGQIIDDDDARIP